MTNKPKALELADILQYKIPSIECLEQSAAELRRLHEVNQALVEALEDMLGWETLAPKDVVELARAALARAKESTA